MDNRNNIHRGIVRFFIERHNEPRLKYIQTYSRIITIRFKIVGGTTIEKKFNCLCLQVLNEGNSLAIEPTVGFGFKIRGSKDKLLRSVLLNCTVGRVEFEEIPLPSSETIDANESVLAYALVTKGFRQVEPIIPTTSASFVIAFAFENSENFFFATEQIKPYPIHSVSLIDLNGFAHNASPRTLSRDYNFIFGVSKWDEISLLETDEVV